jgi:hypothetical protein
VVRTTDAEVLGHRVPDIPDIPDIRGMPGFG